MSYYTASDGSTYYAHKEHLNDFAKYCQNNRLSKVKKYVEMKMINNFDLHKGILLASKYGHINIVKYLLPLFMQEGFTIIDPVYKKNIINYTITTAFLWHHLNIIHNIVRMWRCNKIYHINVVNIGIDLNNLEYKQSELNNKYIAKVNRARYICIVNLGYINKNGKCPVYGQVNKKILL